MCITKEAQVWETVKAHSIVRRCEGGSSFSAAGGKRRKEEERYRRSKERGEGGTLRWSRAPAARTLKEGEEGPSS